MLFSYEDLDVPKCKVGLFVVVVWWSDFDQMPFLTPIMIRTDVGGN